MIKLKFNLMFRNTRIGSIEELRNHVEPNKLLEYYFDNTLYRWLVRQGLIAEADSVRSTDKEDEHLLAKLYTILGIHIDRSEQSRLKRYYEKYLYAISEKKGHQFDDETLNELLSNLDVVAFCQEDLDEIIRKKNSRTIFICRSENIYKITLSSKLKGIKFVGIDNPSVILLPNNNSNLAQLSLTFEKIVYGWSIQKLTIADLMVKTENDIINGNTIEAYKSLKELVTTKNPRASFYWYYLNEWIIIDMEDNGFQYYKENDVFSYVINRFKEYDDKNSETRKAKEEYNPSIIQTLEVLTQIRDKHDRIAMLLLGICYEYGIDTTIDLNKALKWYKRAGKGGLPLAQHFLAYCYENALGIEADVKLAFENYLRAANKGILYSEQRVATCYAYGKGISKDVEKALEWSCRSIQNGDREYIELVNEWIKAWSTILKQKNDSKISQRIVVSYRKAAKHKIPAAEYQLGFFCENGLFMDKQNITAARKWYQLAYDHDYSIAKTPLSIMYLQSGKQLAYGEKADYEKACSFFQSAIDLGNNKAKEELARALILFAGSILYATNVSKMQIEKAIKLLEEAVELDSSDAEFLLGYYYFVGKHVKKNERIGREYLNRSAKKGNESALKLLKDADMSFIEYLLDDFLGGIKKFMN